MKVKMKVNLGTIDAAKLGLDSTKCRAGEVVDVSKDAGDWLIKQGHATDAADDTLEVHAVPPHTESFKSAVPEKAAEEKHDDFGKKGTQKK